DTSFIQQFLIQCRAIALAMREIRKVNPKARLIQTEDLGKTFCTPLLSYQAAFENERRWLTYDLLCGRIDSNHRLWHYLLKYRGALPILEEFLEHPCPPDIIGINHYLTSNRFLDERIERYPPSSHGGNGRHRYADIEAVRVGAENTAGFNMLLQEVW